VRSWPVNTEPTVWAGLSMPFRTPSPASVAACTTNPPKSFGMHTTQNTQETNEGRAKYRSSAVPQICRKHIAVESAFGVSRTLGRTAVKPERITTAWSFVKDDAQ
jgi:hypothetical protein